MALNFKLGFDFATFQYGISVVKHKFPIVPDRVAGLGNMPVLIDKIKEIPGCTVHVTQVEFHDHDLLVVQDDHMLAFATILGIQDAAAQCFLKLCVQAGLGPCCQKAVDTRIAFGNRRRCSGLTATLDYRAESRDRTHIRTLEH